MKSYSRQHLWYLLLSSLVGLSFACSSHSAGQTQSSASVQESPSPQLAASKSNPQQPCTLTAAPAVNGLHFGMTAEEVVALFPGSKDDQQIKSALSAPVDELGISSFSLTPAKYGPPSSFSDVTGITFSLFDKRVSKIYISYGGQWPNVDKFVEHFVGETNLPPPSEWQGYPGMENQMKIIKCTGFEVHAFASGRGLTYVELTDLVAEKLMKDREEKLLKKHPG